MSDYYGNDVDCANDILTDEKDQLFAVSKRASELGLSVFVEDSGSVVLKKENGDIYAEYPTVLNAYSNTYSGLL